MKLRLWIISQNAKKDAMDSCIKPDLHEDRNSNGKSLGGGGVMHSQIKFGINRTALPLHMLSLLNLFLFNFCLWCDSGFREGKNTLGRGASSKL